MAGGGPVGSALPALILKHGPLPKTMQQMTGGGGRHLRFSTLPDQIEIAWARRRVKLTCGAGYGAC